MRVLASSVLLAVGLALTGCGSGDDTAAIEPQDSPSASPTEESTSASPSESPSESASESTSDSAAAGDLTPDGTTLKVGEQAEVEYSLSERKGVIGVTLTKIRKGTPADLKPLKLGAQADGLTPFYADFEVENLSGTDFKFSSLGLTQGALQDDSSAQRLSVIGDFEPCPNGNAGEAFDKEGATYKTCSPFLAPGDNTVTSVRYLPIGADEGYTWK